MTHKYSHLNCLVYHPNGVCNCEMSRYCGECKKSAYKNKPAKEAVREVFEKLERHKLTDLPDCIEIKSGNLPEGDIVEGVTFNAIIDFLLTELKKDYKL